MGKLILTLHKNDVIVIKHEGEELRIYRSDVRPWERIVVDAPKDFEIKRIEAKEFEDEQPGY